MPTLSKPFSKRTVDNLPIGAKRIIYWDGGNGSLKGLGCKVEPTGRKVFVFQYDDAAGRSRRITLGKYGAITVDQARDAAREQAAAVAKSRIDPTAADPATTRRKARKRAEQANHEPTMADLFDGFLSDREVYGEATESTLTEYRRVLGLTEIKLGSKKGERRSGVLRAALGNRRISDVTEETISELHLAHVGTPAMANRYLVLLSACFRFAERKKWIPANSNPCVNVKRIKTRPKRPKFRLEDYGKLGEALRQAERIGLPTAPSRRNRSRGISEQRRAKLTGRSRGPYRPRELAPKPQNPNALALIRFLALSGWRSAEAKSLRWDEVDLDVSVAHLPDTKSEHSDRPLGKAALDLLRSLKPSQTRDCSEHVFPSKDPASPISEFDHVWAAVRHAAGIQITPHGLRHAFITTARSLGYGDHVIAQLVGHVLNATQTSRYGSVPDLKVREAADKVSNQIQDLLSNAETTVVAFPAKEVA
jgi:integrase